MNSEKCLCQSEGTLPSVVATFALLLWTALVCVLGYWAGSHHNGEAIAVLEERVSSTERRLAGAGTRTEEALLRGRIQDIERGARGAATVRRAEKKDLILSAQGE